MSKFDIPADNPLRGLYGPERVRRRYELLGARGELARSLLDLVAQRISGSPGSVYDQIQTLKDSGRLSEGDRPIYQQLIRFRSELKEVLMSSLKFDEADWDAIEDHRHRG